ncbi:MAG: twin-arginine translocation signal domain-containing protein, partial [Candidatus Rokubacteria bacterium]|nr:twin-arginine translocation signal domain-containing protein [Candidatus Rokubacteria bacterium]
MAPSEDRNSPDKTNRSLTRRDFLKGLGAAGATGALTLWSLES